jgi:hypothetical protein
MHAGFEELMPALAKDLRARKYKIPKWEVIKGVTFIPSLNILISQTRKKPKNLLHLSINQRFFFVKKPVTVQKLNLKSPQHHIEVWVGEYRQK